MIAVEFYSAEYSRCQSNDSMKRALPDPFKYRYIDPYKGLPVIVSGPSRAPDEQLSVPVPFKGLYGTIKSFNPNTGIADVELNAKLKSIGFKLDHLRFK
jgi:hypothetical protein